MNIGLIGSGGREHALCQKLSESKITKKIFCFPGNAGTSKIANNIDIDVLNFKKLLQFIKFHKIDIVVVGPEEPLVKGIVDFLEKNKIKVFGPNKFASKLEGSKAFVKNLCKQYKIPTADFKICKNKKQVLNFLKYNKLPLVVKADGIAAGKGVTICKTKNQVLKISKEIFEGKFKSSNKIVLEEFLEGEEASYFLIVDKNNFKFFGTAQDHKRVYEGDKGPNTGGMGAYSPAPIINKIIEKKIINRIDMLKIILNTINNKLKKSQINWKKEKCMTIVLCSKGYPGKYVKNKIIKNIEKNKSKKNEFIYHAGTKFLNEKIVSNGGRVLNFSNLGNNFFSIRKKIIKKIKRLNWNNGFFRKDIGWKVIKKNENNKRNF